MAASSVAGRLSQLRPLLRREVAAGGYRPALDGVRALAVSSVVAYHFGWRALPGGFLGVDVFFVLSGYLISSILLAEHAERGSISMSGFYSRRVRRLFPALALVILAVSIDTARNVPPLDLPARFHDMVAALFYYANWHFIATDQSYFAGLAGASPLRHTWSLSIEEQFYLVWPLLLLGLLRFLGPRWRARLGTGVAVAALLSALAMALVYDPAAPSRAYYGSDGRAQQLLVGVLLAIGLHGLRHSVRAARVWAALAVLSSSGLLLLMHRLHDTSSAYYHGGALVAAVVTALLVASVERSPSGPVAALLSWRPVVWLGKVSYGVYLWHWPVLLWVHDTLARVVVTLGASSLSFYLVERPVRSGRLRWVGKSPRRTALAFGVVCSLVAGTAYAGTRPPSAAEDRIAAQARARALVPCVDLTEPCVRFAAGRGSTVVASIGDSTMEGYDTGLRNLARGRGFTYIQAAVPGCPLSLRPIRSGPHGTQTPRDKLCEEFSPRAYAQLVDQRHTRLFIGTAVRELLPSEDASGHVLLPGTAAHRAVVREGLERAVSVLTRRGATVVLVHILPRGAGPECLSVRTSGRPECTTAVAADRGAATYNKIFDQVAARHPDRVKVVDLSDLVCPQQRCPVTAHGLTLRGDQLHLTRVASAWIAPFLYDRMRRAGVDVP